MNDELSIAIVSKMKHGDLLKAIKERGWSQRQAANYLGMDEGLFGLLINLKWIPKQFSEEFTHRLFELTGKLPEDLFPETFRQTEFLQLDKNSIVYVQTNAALMPGILPKQLSAGSPQEVSEMLELQRALQDALEALPAREAKILYAIYYEGKEHKEVAEQFGVNTQRVKQIPHKALRHLRHPKFTNKLKPFLQVIE